MKRKESRNVASGASKSQSNLHQSLSLLLLAVTVAAASVAIGLFHSDVDSSRGRLNLTKIFQACEDTVLQGLWRQVEENEDVQRVNMQLPQVDVQKELRHVQTLDTNSFTSCTNRSATHLCLVTFFDPQSESFHVTRQAWEEAAESVNRDPVLREQVTIAVVNAALDSFLQHLFAPEMSDFWQEVESKQENDDIPKAFLFGKRNYYPVVTKAFRGGKELATFVDVVHKENILRFLRLQLEDSCTVLENEKALKDFLVDDGLPKVVGCFPATSFEDDTVELAMLDQVREKDRPTANVNCLAEKWAFRNVTASSARGNVKTGVVLRNEKLCAKYGMNPCSVMVVDDVGTRTVFKAFSNTRSEEDVRSYQRDLERFISVHRKPSVMEMTPDNSWDIVERFDFVVVLLRDKNDKGSFQAAKAVLEEVAQGNRIKPFKEKVQFTFADGLSFGPQFGVPENALPALLLFNSLTAEEKLYPQETISEEKDIAEWLRDEISQQQKRVEQTIDLDTREREKEPVELQEQSERNVQEKKKGARQRREEESETSWTDLKKLSVEEDAPKTWNASTANMVWSEFISLYEHLLLYEDFLQNAPEDIKALAENQIIREKLDRFYSYMETRTHFLPMFAILPKTPQDLETLSTDSTRREEFWINLQKLSYFREKLIHRIAEADPWASSMVQKLAQDHAELWNTCVDLIRSRSRAVVERFRLSHDRKPTLQDQPILEIDRRSVEDLSVKEFIEEYAKKRRPVIIHGLKLFRSNWTKAHIAQTCGHHSADLLQKDLQAQTWGGLVSVAENLSLKEFLETHTQNATRQKWYVHDWSLPRECPEIMGPPPFEEFSFPKYFAGDYFQRMPFVGYQHTWPSLFVGANGTESKMHVDSGGTNFWMYLLEGEKEWRFFDRTQTINLYQKPGSVHFFSDVFRQDAEKNPLVATAPMFRGIQRPGDLIFIPGGCPHGVMNHADIVGVSMNYLDLSNAWLYLWMQIVEEDFRDFELYANPQFPTGLSSAQKDLTLGAFKSVNWYRIQDQLDLH